MSDNINIGQKFQKLDEIEHILKRPGIYVGSIESTDASHWVYNHKGRFVKSDINYNPCLLKMFDEIITNSVDEFIGGGNVKRIDVSYSQLTGQIKVSDDGGIPVVKHPEYGVYIPTMIFSELRTGSNFDDSNRKGGGQNGLGAKLASVFSKATLVETCDGKHTFVQSFSDNLQHISEAIVTKAKPTDKPGTTITFTPDYKFLGCKLDADNISKIEKRCYDVAACNPGLKVFLNGQNISTGMSFEKYAGMFVDGDVVVDKGNDFHICLGSNADSEFQFVSFVNGVDVFNGGTHIDYVMNQIIGSIREHVKKKHKIDVKPNNIKQQLFLVMKCNVNAPMFNSQTKEHLTTPVSKYGTEWVPSKAFIKRVLDSEVVEKVLNWAMAEEKRRDLEKLNRANKKASNSSQLKKIVKFEDAISNHREECELFLCEGDSALKSISGARDPKTQGVYPLRGKPINVRSVSASKLSSNQEFIDILAITGLEVGKKVKPSDVRYGKIVIGSDRDNDGFHITGLTINMFYYYWPELVKAGMLYQLVTPLIVATETGGKKIQHEFFNKEDYLKWNEKGIKHAYKYFKGLSTFTTKSIKKYVGDSKYIEPIVYDELLDEQLSMVFDGGRGDDRKEWLSVGVDNEDL